MNKKGFTLVELLAVIAILAILVIIALPNVMSLFNEAKKNSFANEVKEIYKTAQQQWMTDSMATTQEINYGRGEDLTSACVTKPLELSGRTELEYGITVNKAGQVTTYYATDGTYYYRYNETTGLKIEDITDVQSVTNSSKLECDGTSFKLTVD